MSEKLPKEIELYLKDLMPMPKELAFWAKEQGADIHAATPDGCTPLHAAAKRGHKKAVRTLLKAGAQVGFCWTAADNLFLPFQRFFIDIMRGKSFKIVAKPRGAIRKTLQSVQRGNACGKGVP